MLEVKFYKLGEVENKKLRFAVIVSKCKGKWVFVRQKNRETWEIPGGHRETDEHIDNAASRELVEETGAKEFTIVPICIYSVIREDIESFGQLFYAEINTIGELPDFEIGEVQLFDSIPDNLTYPLIQPYLLKKVEDCHHCVNKV